MKKLLFILLTVLLMLPAAMRAQETLTVADGTESSEYLPLYGGYVDSEQKTQMIYPASMLEGLEGAEISSLTFYSSYSNEALPVFTIKIGETTTSFFSSTTFLPTTSMTTVYNGTLTISGGEMTIQFSTPYTYNGGNLILDFSTNGGSDYIWGLDFTGITSNGGGIWYYSYYDWDYDDYEEDEDIEDFLPKLTISYTGGAGVTCPAISALTVSDVDNQSATLSWTAGGEESSWDIYYTTTATDVPDETTEPMATSFDVTYQLSGLEASTTYYVYVRANCGTDDVSRWRQVTFSTSQVAAELPYTQDWEDDEENSQWQFVHSAGDNKWAVGTAVNHTEEGTQSLYVSNNNGMSNAYTNNSTSHSWAYRDIDFGTNAEYVLSFDWNAKGESCCDYLKIYVGTPVAVSSSSYDAPAGATLVGTYNNQDNWQHVDATITSEHQGVQRLYLLWRNDGSVGTNPPAAIDNIEITGTDCGTPLTAVVSEVTGQTATLTWTPAGEESSWDIYYTNVSTDIPNAETEPTETVYDTAYYFTDLTPVTTYYAYVRANCGDQVSHWKAASAFTTTQIAAELPYTQDWEDADENAQWEYVNGTSGVNKWVVGTAANNTEEGTQSLYVSNDYGVSNAYTNTSTSTSWAYRDIDFGTYAEYVLSFDWKNQGESTSYDYLKVYVGNPATVTTSSYDAPSAPAGATLIGTYATKNTWQHVDATINSDHQGVQRLYLLWWNDGSVGTNPPAAIDNIELIGTDCGTPSSVAATDVTADAITISFVPASENDDTWEVAILHHGDTIDENTEIITVYDTTYTFEALDANTVYDVYVRTACGSLWKTATSIHTECVVVTDLPFVDNFDNAPSSSVMPYCWSSFATYPYTSTTNYSAPYSLYFYTSNTSNLAVAPEFDESIDISTLQVTFMYRAGSSSYRMVVGVMTDPENEATFVAVDTVSPDASSSSNWVEREVKLDTYTGEGHYIAFKHVGSSYSSSYIDNVMIYPIPSCVRPDVVTVDAVTATSASLTWTPVGDESAWEYLCVPYGTEVDETTAEWTNTSEANAEITDLTGNTKYTFYVRAYCSDQDQSLARTMDFRTDCDDIQSIPYTEDFESFTTSDPVYCWTVMSGSATISTSYPCSGTKSLRLSGTTNNMVAMPALDREISEVELSFSTRPESFTNDDCGSFQVGYVTDLTSPSSFVAVETYAYDDFTDCQNIDVTFTNAPAGSYIAFRQFDCATNWYWFIDDIDVHEIPSCIKPMNFRVVASSTASVSLEWEDAGTAMTWNVAYGTGSFNPDQATNVETVYDTYVEITDVTPGVANTFYVQADCGGETSRWNGPLSLIPGVYTFGHTGSDTIVGCGYTLYDEGGASGSYTNDADFTLVIYPEEEGQHVGVTGTYETESSWDKLYIYDGAGANEAMLIHTLSGSGSIPANTVSSSGPMTIRFTSDGSTTYSGFELHTNCQSCVAPMLMVDEISSTNVTLTWDDVEGTMTAWQLVYGEAPLTIDVDEAIDVYSNIYSIEGLTTNTAYEAYIRVLCDGGEYSEWSQALNFRTPCAAETIPYTENFETYTSGSSMPDCWTKLRSNTTSTPYPQISTYNGSKILRSAGNTMFVSPMLDEDITTLQMVLDVRKEGSSSGSLEIGVMTNPYDESTFEVVETIPTTETNYSMTEHTVIFANVTNNGNYIAFRQTSTVTNWYFDIDNIVVEPIPACPKPMAVQAINVASTSATIGWQESGDAYTWNIEYGPAGFTPGTGTMLTDIMDNPYELTGLTPTTSYDVYVQSNCDVDGPSSWSAKCNFTTECAVYELPFTENFTTSSMPNCWNLYSGIFGTATPTTTTSGWTFSSTYAFGHVHPKVNIWGTSCNYWLVSPAIDLTTAETPVLSFNLALTAYASSSAPSSTSDDDKFIVAISTDNGATWSTENAVIWNDGDPTADHSYSAISTTGEAIHIDLSDYVGQEIKIAFYGESTVSGGDNDLHIDAVMVYDGEIPVTCDVPTNLSSNNVQYNSANITWTAGGSESAWNLQWRAQNGTWTPVNNLTAANYSLTGLTAQTTYEVQVQAVCDGSTTSDWTAIHSFTTPAAPAEPCDAPTNLQVADITATSAKATWTPGGSETSWKVGYKLQSAGQWQEATVSTTTYSIEGLTANSTYDFRVKAVCSADNQSDFVTTSFTTSGVGIDNVELANSVSLMPNPADNYIEMTVNGNVNVKEAAIYNAFGQMIQMVQLTDNHARINLDNYASGMYFVRVAGDNAVATKKFIKK